MRQAPEFNVIVETDKRIEFRNFFEFGQWEKIKKELTSLHEKLKKVYKNAEHASDIKLTFNSLAKEYFIDKRFKFRYLTCIDDFIEERLKSECMYYFWSKCEYEIVIRGWPNEECNRKIDIYEQLIANWNIFKDIALREIL